MNESMSFISPESMSDLRRGSIESMVESYRRALAELNDGAEFISATSGEIIAIVGGNVVRYSVSESEGDIIIGDPVVDPTTVYGSVAEWVGDVTESIVDDIARGGMGDSARNRLHVLAEAVSKGNAYTAEGVLRRMQAKLESRSSWTDIYAVREREIRSYIRGRVGEIESSVPKRRFRVLATEHAPEEPERFRSGLIASFESVLKAYAGVVEALDSVSNDALSVYESFVNIDDGVLLQNLTGFVTSLRDSAESVSKDGGRFLKLESADGDLARLARFHDLLADGLGDYLISTNFVTAIVADIAGEKNR